MPSRMRVAMIGCQRAVRSCTRPGGTGEIRTSVPSGAVMTRRFTPCLRCLPEWSARSPRGCHRRGRTRRVSVERDVAGVGGSQGHGRPGGPAGQERDDGMDGGMGGADGGPEPRGDPPQRLVRAQVHQCGKSTPGQQQLAPAVTLPGDDRHRDPLHKGKGMRDTEYGTTGNQRSPKTEELNVDTTLNSPGAPPVSQPASRHPISGHPENAQ